VWQALYSLEQRVERLATSLGALVGQVQQMAQQLAQIAARSGSSGGGPSGLVRVWLPTGIAAGTFGTPTTATDAEVRVRSSSGYSTTSTGAGVTVYNSDTTAVGSGKAAWCLPRGDGGYDLVVADC
jgi:hypothetical protein